jgi:site-specific DNA recombinase
VQRIRTLRQKIHEIERRQTRQVQVLESKNDLEPAMLKQVSRRVSQLEDERESSLVALAKLENADHGVSSQGSIQLIDCLPLGNFEMAQAPEALLRRLFEVFRLRIRYNRQTDAMSLEVTVDSTDFESIVDSVTHLVRAPNRTLFKPPPGGFEVAGRVPAGP